MKKVIMLLIITAFVVTAFTGCSLDSTNAINKVAETFDATIIPEYQMNETPYAMYNDNKAMFTDEELADTTSESYSPLDSLGRAGSVEAYLTKDIPDEGAPIPDGIEPTGWEGKIASSSAIYIRRQLNAFTKEAEQQTNYIISTHQFDVAGMLPIERYIRQYIDTTGYDVKYRVTPIYDGKNLIPSGVLVEAKAVNAESDEQMLDMCTYCYNVQDNCVIDYSTGNYSEE